MEILDNVASEARWCSTKTNIAMGNFMSIMVSKSRLYDAGRMLICVNIPTSCCRVGPLFKFNTSPHEGLLNSECGLDV